MKIYHYHPETNVLLGEGVADESPREPGVWLIPAHATAKVPPKAKDGHHCVYNGYSWKSQPIPEAQPEPEPETITEQVDMPPMTPEQKLAAAGLTVAELRTLLGLD